jgi:hypothetical protein
VSLATRSGPTVLDDRVVFRVANPERRRAGVTLLQELRMIELRESSRFDRILVDTVTSAFPPHEHEGFIAHYRGLVAAWSRDQRAQGAQ